MKLLLILCSLLFVACDEGSSSSNDNNSEAIDIALSNNAEPEESSDFQIPNNLIGKTLILDGLFSGEYAIPNEGGGSYTVKYNNAINIEEGSMKGEDVMTLTSFTGPLSDRERFEPLAENNGDRDTDPLDSSYRYTLNDAEKIATFSEINDSENFEVLILSFESESSGTFRTIDFIEISDDINSHFNGTGENTELTGNFLIQ